MGYGEFVHKVRLRSGKSREEFADYCGVSLTTLSRWENNKTAVREKNLKRMLELVGLSLDRCLFLPEEIFRREDLLPVVKQIVEELANPPPKRQSK